jgi:small subunit ribosomal protein S2
MEVKGFMRNITLEELLEAGCHFGHQVTRQNPKSRDFVFEARDNIHIIDLEKTKAGLDNAAQIVKKIAEKPDSTFIILGSKRQASDIVKEEVKRASEEKIPGVYYVTSRWIGGTLTNFSEVLKNYKRLKDLTAKLQNETERAKYTKKEISLMDKERQKLESFYSGTKDMTKIPDLLFIIDTHLEDLAVREGNAMSVPIVGIVDTNADPDPIDHVIPANDDAAGSIKLITSYILDAWIEGKTLANNAKSEEKTIDVAKNANDEKIEKSKKVEPKTEEKATEKKATKKTTKTSESK